MAGPLVSEISETPTETVQATTFTQMPALGLRGLALDLYPGDRDDPEKVQQHIADLFALNTDRLRNDNSFIAGQLVKIPVEA